jgi:hypothetical protein
MALPAGLLSLLGAVAKSFAALAKFLADRQLISAGEAAGRAASERDRAAAAKRAEDDMRAIAEKPATREEMLKRLEDGTA